MDETAPLRLTELRITGDVLGDGAFATVFKGVATFVVDGGASGSAAAATSTPLYTRDNVSVAVKVPKVPAGSEMMR